MSVVESKHRTTGVGGITGRGFMPGESGNPGGRPKGLARRVRELVGDDGRADEMPPRSRIRAAGQPKL
jgi:Family of unknown function (DUF5681)